MTASAQISNQANANPRNAVLQNYIKLATLPSAQRPQFFSGLSEIDKADTMRFHLALQLVKRPWLNQSHKDFILETMSIVTPESYDRSNPQTTAINRQNEQIAQQKMLLLFSKKEAYDIFVSLGGDSKDIEVLQKYGAVTKYFYTSNRRQAFRRLSPLDKSLVMKLHLSTHISRSDLTLAQRKVVLDALSLLTAEAYTYPQGTPERMRLEVELKSLTERVLSIFNPRDAVEIFLKIGGSEGDGPENLNGGNFSTSFVYKQASISSMLLNKNLAKYQTIAYNVPQQAPSCGCSSNSDLCSLDVANTICRRTDCNTPWHGCGFLWMYTCDGICKSKNLQDFVEGNN